MLPMNGYPSDEKVNSPLLEIALVLVRLDHVASRIVNADHRKQPDDPE